MVKTYGSHKSQLASGRENLGHADVVIKYKTFCNPNTGVTWLKPKLGCSAKDNLPIDECSDCEERQRPSCCFTHSCVVGSLLLGSLGLCALCLWPFIEGPRCSFIYITVSASNAILSLTGGITSAGMLTEGARCRVFGRDAIVVADKRGGSYVLTALQLSPVLLVS